MPLQELDHRVNQVREENRKDKDEKDSSRAVNTCAHHAKEQYGQQDVEGAAMGECHLFSKLEKSAKRVGAH
jgi:hypothetical protein